MTTTGLERACILTSAVRAATGTAGAEPRPGQAMLFADVQTALQQRADLVAIAPTGSGKTFVALSAAFERSVHHGERTVISTHSLSLMDQLYDKDVPVMHRAGDGEYGHVQVAFLRGVGNYVDPGRTIATAQALLGTGSEDFETLASRLEAAQLRIGDLSGFQGVGTARAFQNLVVWALRQYGKAGIGQAGDRHSCPVPHTDNAWAAVSAQAAEADDGSRFGVTSKAEEAKLRAGEADVVITNHSLLAVQAAHAIRVITGGAKLGTFDNVIVDEAHALPDAVRAQGAAKVSGGHLISIAHQTHRAAGSPGGSMRRWLADADHLADAIERELRPLAPSGTRNGQQEDARRLGAADAPLDELHHVLKTWLAEGAAHLTGQGHDPASRLAIAAATDRIDGFLRAVKAVRKHRTGWARWVERPEPKEGRRRWSVANVSPVSVGWLLEDNVWSDPVPETEPGHDHDDDHDVDDPRPRDAQRKGRRLAVIALSATLPAGFAVQASLRAQPRTYPSPFQDAYANSALIIPHMPTGSCEDVSSPGWGNKLRFDTKKHAAWSSRQIIGLVAANRGRALILSATAENGRAYAAALRKELPDLVVHSQWDGGTPGEITATWRDDIGSVLVGTKSLMTGVDAPGETCTLVIIDRVPRSPRNAIDEARTEEIAARLQTSPMQAAQFTYVEDAALLLSQSSGRLIRSIADAGAVCLLDPRMLKRTPLTYPEPTRRTYMSALEPFAPFGTKIVDLAQARTWLADHASRGRG
ncbi:ATP-dependent DNA helicase [Microbacterium xylanilyticum]